MSSIPARVDANPSVSTEPPAISNPPTSKVRPFLAAGATAFLLSLAISNNWFFACVFAGLCAGFAAVAIVWLLESMAARYVRSTPIQRWLPVCIGIACSYFSFLTVDQAFERIFGIEPPNGVNDAHVLRAYCGGGGDEDTILWFHATPGAVEALLDEKAFQRVPEDSLLEPRGRAVMVGVFATWSQAFAGRLQRIWLEEGGLGMPDVYAFRPEDRAEETWLVYDRQKGFVIVIFRLS